MTGQEVYQSGKWQILKTIVEKKYPGYDRPQVQPDDTEGNIIYYSFRFHNEIISTVPNWWRLNDL